MAEKTFNRIGQRKYYTVNFVLWPRLVNMFITLIEVNGFLFKMSNIHNHTSCKETLSLHVPATLPGCLNRQWVSLRECSRLKKEENSRLDALTGPLRINLKAAAWFLLFFFYYLWAKMKAIISYGQYFII